MVLATKAKSQIGEKWSIKNPAAVKASVSESYGHNLWEHHIGPKSKGGGMETQKGQK